MTHNLLHFPNGKAARRPGYRFLYEFESHGDMYEPWFDRNKTEELVSAIAELLGVRPFVAEKPMSTLGLGSVLEDDSRPGTDGGSSPQLPSSGIPIELAIASRTREQLAESERKERDQRGERLRRWDRIRRRAHFRGPSAAQRSLQEIRLRRLARGTR